MTKVIRAIEVRIDEPENKEVFWLDISDLSNYQLKVYDIEAWRVIMDSNKTSMEVIDSLTSTSVLAALSANQGRLLMEKIDDLNKRHFRDELKVEVPEYRIYVAGETYTLSIKAIVTSGDFDATEQYSFYVNDAAVASVGGVIELINVSDINKSFDIKAVNNSSGETHEVNVNFDFGYYSYWSPIEPGFVLTEDALTTFQKQLTLRGDVVFADMLNDNRICFVCPSEYGSLHSIEDGNCLEVMHEYNREIVPLGNSEYYVYTTLDSYTSVRPIIQKYKYEVV